MKKHFVPMVGLIGQVLEEQQLRQEILKFRAGSKWVDHGLVFTNKLGGPLEPVRVNRAFKKALQKAALPEMQIKELRHSTGTILTALGIPASVIADILGHADTSTTTKYYIHVDDAMRQQAGDLLEKALTAK